MKSRGWRDLIGRRTAIYLAVYKMADSEEIKVEAMVDEDGRHGDPTIGQFLGAGMALLEVAAEELMNRQTETGNQGPQPKGVVRHKGAGADG